MIALALDFETTGLDPATGAVTEIGWCLSAQGEEVSAGQILLRPPSQIAWEPAAAAMAQESGLARHLRHGLGGHFAAAEVLLCELATCAEVVVAHYAAFERLWVPSHMRSHPWGCTRALYRALYPDAPSASLTPACQALGVAPPAPAHRALPDARACAALWWALCQRGAALGLGPAELLALATPQEGR
jgi:DNA polymerase III epsilon subunit-like protein